MDAEPTIGVQSRALIISEPIHDNRTGTLPEDKKDERAHVTTGEVLGVGVDMSRAELAGGIVRKDRWCRHRQSPSTAQSFFTTKGPPYTADGDWEVEC